MAGADESYFPKPEKRNPVFGDGSSNSPYFEQEPRAAFAPETPLRGSAGGSAGAQLDLADDTRLPWLEGDDAFEEEHPGSGQGVLLVVLGLIAVALIVGAVFWLTRKKPESAQVADGGVISAPKQPYKVRPSNPGGEVVAGTGDTSFAVAEGQRRQPNIGGSEAPADAPSPRPAPASSTSAPPEAKATPAPVVSGIGVQVGAYATKAQAEAGWATLKTQYEGLASVNHRIVQGQADIGTVYRLQAVPGDAAAARALCSGMKSAGLSCQVKN